MVDTGCITRIENMAKTQFEILSYTDAIKLLQNSKKQFTYPVHWGVDLQSEHERFIAE